jgi:hypothetical protein
LVVQGDGPVHGVATHETNRYAAKPTRIHDE